MTGLTTRLASWIGSWKYRRAMRRIRGEMAAMGYQVEGLTDADIEHAVTEMSDAIARVGIPAKQAAAALTEMVTTMNGASIELRALAARRRLGDQAPPPSWEVEREAFIRRLDADPRASA